MRVSNKTPKTLPEVVIRNLTVALVVIVGIGLLGFCSCAKPAASEPNEAMVDSVMEYIKQNHPDAAPFIKDTTSWTPVNPVMKYGYSEITYTGDGWSVTIGHTASPDEEFGVTAAYNGEEVVWTGTVKVLVTETSYTKK